MTIATLRELVNGRENDYSVLAERYAAATGGELVVDPFGSYRHGPRRLTRSVSVLIGSFNSVSSLVPALIAFEHSSMNQLYPELLEVIVVDDGSTDGTREVLLELELDLRWTYIRQSRGGLTQAHNTGLAFAEGEIVVFSDSDMVHLPRALEELMKRHQLLPHVTLIGFRAPIDPDDPRLDITGLPANLENEYPRFWLDHRLSFPGWPANICRDTRHLIDFGGGRRLQMCDGSRFELEGLVVGALCSLERSDLLRIGGSDERLIGYGAEDTLIGARSFALGNPIIPVYSAVAWHVAHGRRGAGEGVELNRNRRALAEIYDEQFVPRAPDPRRWRARAAEVVEPRRRRGIGREPAAAYPPRDGHPVSELEWGMAAHAVGRFRDALTSFDAVAEDRHSAHAHTQRARSLLGLGDPVAAEAAAASALALDDGASGAGLVLARALAAQGEYHRAGEVMRTQAARQPPPFEASWLFELGTVAHKQRANYHAAQGLDLIAVTDFDLALTVDPDYEWAHFDRGVSLEALGRSREAIASVRRAACLLHPEDGHRTWIHGKLGELRLGLGEQQYAKAELDRALRLFPDNARAQATLALLAESADVTRPFGATEPLTPPIDDIPGWFSPAEAELLSSAVARACQSRMSHGSGTDAPAVLELGSYYGRSTVTIAWTIKALGHDGIPFFAVDPHEGYEYGGSEDTETAMRANVARHGVSDWVNVLRMCSHDFELRQPLRLLFIDALHEYEDVRRDYEHFRDHLLDGALVAFHDYDACCPGVQRCVDELIDTGELEFLARAGMLVVLTKCGREREVRSAKGADIPERSSNRV